MNTEQPIDTTECQKVNVDPIVMPINTCPFCKKSKVKFEWSSYPMHGKVICVNWQDECCATGPQSTRRDEDEKETAIINRAISKWNAA